MAATAWLRRFGGFWYDFLIGDRWELFIGPIAVLGLAALLVAVGVPGAVAGFVLVAGIITVAGVSIANAVR
jgi:hypothetical protein